MSHGMLFDHTEEERYENDILDLVFKDFESDFSSLASGLNEQFSTTRDYIYDFLSDGKEHNHSDIKSWVVSLVFDEDLVESYVDELLCRHDEDGLTERMLKGHKNIEQVKFIQDKMISSLVEFAEKFPYVGDSPYYSDPE